MKTATADLAMTVMFSRYESRREWQAAGFFPTDDDTQLAVKALEWARETFGSKPAEERNDFEHNMHVASKGDVMNLKNSGLAAYIVAGYLKEQERLVRAKAFRGRDLTASRHFGDVGEKVLFKAVVIDVKHIDSQYGTTTLVKLLTEDGNVATWFASNAPESVENAMNAEEPPVFNIVGTIKDHGVFKDVQQTQLTRCKVVDDADLEKEVKKLAKEKAKKAKG
jgi:hypothetical protein